VDLNENCAKYVGFLRALYLIHQNHHWVASGDAFYGNHLLFERIYKSAAENADSAAEKFIGLFGSDALDIAKQPTLIHDILENHIASNTDLTNLIIASTNAEKEFVAFAEDFYKQLKESEKMSLGLDDMIMSISNDRETSLYLLQQVHSGEKKMSKLNTLAKKFKVKLAQVAAAAAEDTSGALREKLNSLLTVNLANRNWGEVGFNSLNVVKRDGKTVINCNLVIPSNSPPFTDKVKYPQGLNQFKQEMMDLISNAAHSVEPDAGLVQIVTVNGK